MFTLCKYMYLVINLVFPTSAFGVGFFLIAPFHDHYQLFLLKVVSVRMFLHQAQYVYIHVLTESHSDRERVLYFADAGRGKG